MEKPCAFVQENAGQQTANRCWKEKNQCFEELDDILRHRHRINPQLVSGTARSTPKKKVKQKIIMRVLRGKPKVVSRVMTLYRTLSSPLKKTVKKE